MSDVEKRDYGSDDEHSLPTYTGFKGFYYKPVTQVVLLAIICFMCQVCSTPCPVSGAEARSTRQHRRTQTLLSTQRSLSPRSSRGTSMICSAMDAVCSSPLYGAQDYSQQDWFSSDAAARNDWLLTLYRILLVRRYHFTTLLIHA